MLRDHAHRLRDIHGRAAADGDEPVAVLGGIQGRRLVDELDVGVRPYVGEDDRVSEGVENAAGDAGREHALVRDQQRPPDSQARDHVRETRQRAGSVDQLRGRIDDAYELDVGCHLLPPDADG